MNLIENKNGELNVFQKAAAMEKNRSQNQYRHRVENIVLDKKNQKVLIEKHDNKKNILFFPGGGIDHGESTQQAATREVAEETGKKVKNAKRLNKSQVIMPWNNQEKASIRKEKWTRLEDHPKGNETYFVISEIIKSQKESKLKGKDGDIASTKWMSYKDALEYLQKQVSKKTAFFKIDKARLRAFKKAIKGEK